MKNFPYQRYWLKFLNIPDFKISYKKVNHRGVYDQDKKKVTNTSIVAASLDLGERQIRIFHSRKLTELDLLHELIHALYPELTHSKMDIIAKELIFARKYGDPKKLISEFDLDIYEEKRFALRSRLP